MQRRPDQIEASGLPGASTRRSGGALVGPATGLAGAAVAMARPQAASADTTGLTSGGTEVLRLSNVASAVNALSVTNAATGGGPTISVSGSDMNIGITIQPKGSGVLALKGIPAARAYNSSTVSVPHNTNTVMPLASERYDTDGMHDTATNNSRLTCRTACKYRS